MANNTCQLCEAEPGIALFTWLADGDSSYIGANCLPSFVGAMAQAVLGVDLEDAIKAREAPEGPVEAAEAPPAPAEAPRPNTAARATRARPGRTSPGLSAVPTGTDDETAKEAAAAGEQ